MIPGHRGISRRAVLKMMAAAGASTATVSQWPRRASSASRLVVGAAYVGPKDDYGWNQGHAQGVTAVKKIDGVKVVEEENVPETVQVQKTMESMISLDGASLIFATSFGYWVLPVKEAEAVNSLADQGIDVVTCHVDSPKVVIETAEKRGIFSSGYHVNQSTLAPKGYLTGAEWNWEKVYTDYVNWLRDGKSWPHMRRGGLRAGIVRNAPYGPAVSEKARKQADDAKAKFTDGSFVIYKGPMKDNTGKTVIPTGKSYDATDIWLESMDWLVDGVRGSTRS